MELERLLKFLTDTLQEGKEFTVEQAPQFVQELLRWRFWEAAINMVGFGMICILSMVFLAPIVAEQCKENDVSGRRTARLVVWAISAAVLVLVIGVNATTMVQIRVAPRVVLLEMVRNLIGRQP